jgi:hypothetical protein
MRLLGEIIVLLGVSAAVPSALWAQPSLDLSPLQIAVACAPPPVIGLPSDLAPRVVGAHDAVARALLDRRDVIVLDGGTIRGVQIGQEYFVRRRVTIGMPPTDRTTPRVSRTAGWVRIVGSDETRALASVEHACGPILQGDYLEPFAVPVLPGKIDVTDTSGEPDFHSTGRVLFGDDEHVTASIGEFMLIDKGADQGVTAGRRFAIYRNVDLWWLKGEWGPQPELPLAAVGEAVAVNVGSSVSLVRITAERDAVRAGDLAVLRK